MYQIVEIIIIWSYKKTQELDAQRVIDDRNPLLNLKLTST